MKILKVTSVMIVADVKAESKLWHSLGFQTTAEVPHGQDIGFAILSSGDAEVMLQTFVSLSEDLPAVAAVLGKRTSYLFADVESLKDAMDATKQEKLLVKERETFYGTREIFIQSQAGEVIGFAQKI